MKRLLLFVGTVALAVGGVSSPADAAGSVADPQIASGEEHTCALSFDGTVRCWGSNKYGQLGNPTNSGTANPNPAPLLVTGIADATQISAGDHQTCARLATGTVRCWGLNDKGQLGSATNTGTTTPNPVPIAVSGITNAKQVDAGGQHTCALLETAQLTCWGMNWHGQLGNLTNNGTSNANPTPSVVGGVVNVIGMSAGGRHTCAAIAGGTVSCWGKNQYGQLGNATNTGTGNPNPHPTIVSGVATASAITGGGDHTCALLSGGTASCWGYNGNGELGRAANSGTSNPNPAPGAVTGLSGATAVSGGASHTCALLSGGTASCWGYNSYGQLGNTTNVVSGSPNATPLGVGGLTGATQISSGEFHTCAVVGGNAVSCWGHNGYGQLGNAVNNGTVDPNPTPAVVGGLNLANRLPYGRMVLSLTDGRGYGMLAYAIDPETGGPVRMRVTIQNLLSNEYDWNYTWNDMPLYTGVNRTESLVFLAQLPPGEHLICFDALDPQGAGWTRLDCRTHTVK